MSHFRLHTRTNGKDRLKYVIAGIACILAVGAAGYALHSIGTARAKSRETVELHTGEELEQYLLDSESEDYNLNGSYRLEEDLELGWLYQSIGNNVEPFTGKFDGNGHVISGLERPLFGVVKKAEIENLFFSGALITEPFTYYDGEHYVDGYSALAAYAVDSKIRNCGMDGEIYTASPSEAEYQVAKASPSDAEERKKPSETESSEAPESSTDAAENGVAGGNGNGAGGSVTDGTEEGPGNETVIGNENETGDVQEETSNIESSVPDNTNQETDSQTESNPENFGNEGSQESGDQTDITEGESPEQGGTPAPDTTQAENAGQSADGNQEQPAGGNQENPAGGNEEQPDAGNTGGQSDAGNTGENEAGESGQPEAPAENSASVHPVNRQYLMLKISELPDAEAAAAAADQATPSDADQVDGETTDNSQPDKELPEPASPSDAKDTGTDKEEIEYIGNPFGDVYILVTADRVTAGGLVAETAGETLISDSFVLVSLSSELDGVETYAGGLAGILGAHTRTENSYASGVLSCDDIAGGFAAINDGRIENSYSSMVLGEAGTIRGGFTALGTGKFKGCVYDKQMACAKDRNEDTELDDTELEDTELEETELEEPLPGNGPSGFPDQLPPDESQTETEEDHTGMIQVGPGEWIEAPAEQPAAEEPLAEQPVAEEAPAEQPVAEEPLAEQPATEEPSENPEQPDPVIAQEPSTSTQVRELPEFTLKGLPTSQMVGLDAQIPGTWYYSENAYPQLESFAYHGQQTIVDSSKASVIALVLPDEFTLADVLEDGELILPTEIDGQEIQWEAEGHVIIDENNRVRADQTEKEPGGAEQTKPEQTEPEQTTQTEASVSSHEVPKVGSKLESISPEEVTTKSEPSEPDSTPDAAPDSTEPSEDSENTVKLKGSIGESTKNFSISSIRQAQATYAVTMTWQEIGERVDSGDLSSFLPGKSSDGYYEISTAEALAWFAYQVNLKGNNEINGRLTADIDLFGGTYTDNTYNETTNNIDDAVIWIPLGNLSSTLTAGYCGIFDGNQHHVSNMRVGTLSGDNGLRKGFIGVLGDDASRKAGIIKDFGVKSGKVTGLSYTAGIAAVVQGTGSKVQRCWNGAEISGISPVGGIIALMGSSSVPQMNQVVEGCYNLGTLTMSGTAGGPCIGGIAGVVFAGSGGQVIRNSYNQGRVTGPVGDNINIGGLVGVFYGTKMENCYNSGIVSSGYGIAAKAYSGRVKNCYYEKSAAGIISEEIPDAANAGVMYGVTVSQLKSWSAAYALNGYGLESDSEECSWTWTTGGVPTLYNKETNPEKKLAPAENWSVIGQGVADGLIGMRNTRIQTPIPEGDGSRENPYILTNAEQLAWFAGEVNRNKESSTLSAKMTANMDLSGLPYTGYTSAEVEADITKALVWVPISEYISGGTRFYVGTFDGAGHYVTNMYAIGETYQGFFSMTGSRAGSSAVIKDFGVKSGKVTRTGTAGGSDAGIAAWAEGKNVVFQRCWNGALIDSGRYGAGIVGVWNVQDSLIEDCYNVGEVKGKDSSGGIIGQWSRNEVNYIRNCYNLGPVTVTTSAPVMTFGSGGIIGICRDGSSTGGYQFQMENCYSAGKIVGNKTSTGGLIGYTTKSIAPVKNCYYDKESSGQISAGAGITEAEAPGLTTEQAKSWSLAYALNGYRREAKDASETSFTWKEGEYPTLYWDGRTDEAGNPVEKLGPAKDWEVIGMGMDAGLIGNPYTGEKYSLPAGDGVTTPYQIGSAEQLAWFARKCSIYGTGNTAPIEVDFDAVLTGYIDLGGDAYVDSGILRWVPIASYPQYYKGTFDGAGYMIDRMEVEEQGAAGLFGWTICGVVIKNLGIGPRSKVTSTGEDVSGRYGGAGALIGIAATYGGGISTFVIEGCYSRAAIHGYESNCTGGLIGMEGANSTVARRISGCYVAGPIDVNGVAVTKGAMISKISVANDSSANTGIYNCYWDSDILGTSMTPDDGTYSRSECSGKTTAELKQTAIIASLNKSITEKNWIYNDPATSKINDGYPILKNKNLITTWRDVAVNLELPTPTVQSPSGDISTHGTEANPYLLSSAEDLAWFANEVNNGKINLCGKMMTDIDLFGSKYSGVDCAADGSNIDSAIVWVPMGGDPGQLGKGYMGIFDGNGCQITNIFVSDTGGATGFIMELGSNDQGGLVKDLGIASGKIIGLKNHTAGITGLMFGDSQIRRCWNGAEIQGATANVGGIVGAILRFSDTGEGTYTPVVEGCYNIGKVNGKGSTVGGIAGNAGGGENVRARIRNCYNLGEITGSYSASGIVSGLTTGSLVENCYNAGTITAPAAYGIANTAAGQIKNCYFDKTKTTVSGATGNDNASTVGAIDTNGIKSWGAAWALNGYGLESVGATGVTDVTDTTDSSFTWKEGGYPALCWPGDDDYQENKLRANTWLDVGYAVENDLLGIRGNTETIKKPSNAGTEEDPYQLTNVEQLAWYGYISTIKTSTSVQMQADMDLFGSNYTGETYDSSRDNIEQALRWVPIGKNAEGVFQYNMSKTFDGNGHYVTNMLVNEPSYNTGFIAQASGTVKDFGVKSGKITGGAGANAAIVGSTASSGKVYRCWNGATVRGVNWTGGIVGQMPNCSTVVIEGCFNMGDISGTSSYTAGIAGGTANVHTGPTIRNCGNTGKISGTYSSGIVNLIGLTENGKWGSLSNCYNAGVVTGTSRAGAIMYAKEGSIFNCYYDTAKTANPGTGFSTLEARARTTEQLQSWAAAYALNGYGLDQTEDSFAGTATTESAWTYLPTGDTPVYPTICWPGSSDASAPKKLGVPDSWEDVGFGVDAGLIGNRTTGVVTARPGGNGNSTSPYLLTNAEQLAWFGYQVNHGKPKIYGTMTTDIDLFGTPYTGITYDAGADNIDDAVKWKPMGLRSSDWNTGYQGTFDGDGYLLNHLKVKVTGFGDMAGFIEVLGGAGTSGVVKKLGLQSGKITASAYAGGIAGVMMGRGSMISGCWNGTDIVGPTGMTGSGLGGIVGLIGIADHRSSGLVIEGCWNEGTIAGKVWTNSYFGGMAGRLFNTENSVIRNCYNQGTIAKDAGEVKGIGGILGYVDTNANSNRVEYCYNSGNIASARTGVTGAIIGFGKNDNTTVTGCYYDTANSTGIKLPGANITESEARSLTTAQLQSWAAAYALNRNGMKNSASDYGNFTWKSGEYPSLCYAESTDYDTRKLQPAESWEVIGQGVKDQLLKDSTGAFIPEPVKDGAGAYSIECAEQLGWFGMTVNSDTANQTLNANLTKDIDLLGDRYGGTEDARIPWIPMGTYQGHLGEGQAKVYQIKNMFAGGVPGKVIRYAGLIGILSSTGQVTQIGMEAPIIGPTDANAPRGIWGGAIAGQMDGAETMISECYARNAVIRVGSVGGAAGGITGKVYNGGKIQDCYVIDSDISSMGTTSGSTSAAGGISGGSSGTTLPVENCYVAGNTLAAMMGSSPGYTNPVAYATTKKNCYSDGSSESGVENLSKSQYQTDQLNTLDATERRGDDRVWYTSLSNEATHGYPTLDAPVKLTVELEPPTTLISDPGDIKGGTLPSQVMLRGIREEGGSSTTYQPVNVNKITANYSTYGYESANKMLAFCGGGQTIADVNGASLTDPAETSKFPGFEQVYLYNAAAYNAPKRTFMLDVCDTGKTTRYEICITVKDPASKTMSLTFPVNPVTIELEPGMKRKSESNEVTVTNGNSYPLTGRISGVTPLTGKNVELMPIKAKLDTIDERTDLVKAGVKLGISGVGGGTDEYYYNPKDGGNWVSYEMVGKEKTGQNSLKFHYFMEYSPLYAGPEQTFGYEITYSSGIPKEDVTTTTMTADTAGSGS